MITTAARLFARLGYTERDRKTAPDAIATSQEFASLCPATATYLVKAL